MKEKQTHTKTKIGANYSNSIPRLSEIDQNQSKSIFKYSQNLEIRSGKQGQGGALGDSKINF